MLNSEEIPCTRSSLRAGFNLDRRIEFRLIRAKQRASLRGGDAVHCKATIDFDGSGACSNKEVIAGAVSDIDTIML
jgi:hypothetical protein